MEKNKKTLKLLLSMFLTFVCCFNALAFNEKFFGSDSFYREKRIKTSKLKPTQKKIEKGFYFDMVFEVKNDKDIPVNYPDLVIRHFKKIAKEKFGKDSYVNSLFKNYKVFCKTEDNKKKYKIRFYVFMKKNNSLNMIKEFLKEINILSKSYKDIFSKSEYITETEYSNYKDLYSSTLLKRLKRLEKEVKNCYKEEDYKKINDLFLDFSQKISTTTNILSAFVQNSKIKEKASKIQKILDYIIKNNLEKSKKDKYDDDDDDDDDDDEYYYYNDYEKEKLSDYFDDDDDGFFKFKNKKNKAFPYLKSLFVKFFKDCRLNANKLKEIEYNKFKNSLISLNFNDSIVPVKRETRKYNGYFEAIYEI